MWVTDGDKSCLCYGAGHQQPRTQGPVHPYPVSLLIAGLLMMCDVAVIRNSLAENYQNSVLLCRCMHGGDVFITAVSAACTAGSAVSLDAHQAGCSPAHLASARSISFWARAYHHPHHQRPLKTVRSPSFGDKFTGDTSLEDI